jgi:hypothetical protein
MPACQSARLFSFADSSLRSQDQRRHWRFLRTSSICAALCWAPQAQAQSCASIFETIRKEAMYCTFFCDQEKLQPLQQAYEAGCIAFSVAPSLFDLDSRPLPFARTGDTTVGAAMPADDVPTRYRR